MNPIETVEKLATSVHAKEVVFFIGSGFSIDSEGNSAWELMARLYVRFHAMVAAYEDSISDKRKTPKIKQVESELKSFRENLEGTFSLKGKETDAAIYSLAARYYEANDWFCGVFESLLVLGSNLRHSDELLATIEKYDEQYRQNLFKAPLAIPLVPIDPQLFRLAAKNRECRDRDIGKALFLDTLGFRDSRVMGGAPTEDDIATFRKSYAGKLYPRHFVFGPVRSRGILSNRDHHQLRPAVGRCMARIGL
ncbi:MAG: hypothetical protein KDA87_25170 [Planctomycetales bacterium]|nr:hypothetical protein [Planctomycetales bacterium]